MAACEASWLAIGYMLAMAASVPIYGLLLISFMPPNANVIGGLGVLVGIVLGAMMPSVQLYSMLPLTGSELGIAAIQTLPTEVVHHAFQYGFMAAAALCAAIIGFLSPATALKDHDSQTAH